jgi:hypothetical protein
MTKKKEWNDLTKKQKISSVCFLLLLAVLILMLVSGSVNNDPQYKVDKKECAEPLHCSFFVKIDTKLSEKDLTLIANKLKESVTPSTEAVFVFYYLPCMKTDLEYEPWARTSFSSKTFELEVEILDGSLEKNPACLSSQ